MEEMERNEGPKDEAEPTRDLLGEAGDREDPIGEIGMAPPIGALTGNTIRSTVAPAGNAAAGLLGNAVQGSRERLVPDETSARAPRLVELPPPAPARSDEGAVSRGLRLLIDSNRRASHRLNLLCAARYGRVDGSSQFPIHLQRLLRPGLRIVDLGGGKHPAVSPRWRRHFGVHVVGVDISAEELALAPPDAYDEAVVADAMSFVREGGADLVIAQALTEHVRDTEAMWRSVYATLVPGGRTLHFVPNGRALFARLNRLLPEEVKRTLLHRIYPESRAHLGFKAYYDKCSPSETRAILRAVGFRKIQIHTFYSSNYFTFLWPAHVANVALQLLAQITEAEDRCESFIVEAVK